MNQAKVIAIISIAAIAMFMALVAFKKPDKYKNSFKYISSILLILGFSALNFAKGEINALRGVLNYVKPEHVQIVTNDLRVSEKLSSFILYFLIGSSAYNLVLFLLALYVIKRSDKGDFWR